EVPSLPARRSSRMCTSPVPETALMKTRICLAITFSILPILASSASSQSAESVVVTSFVGASVQLEYGGLVVHVDPWGQGDYSSAKPADLILVTDTPTDHLDPELIAALRKPGAPVVLPDR